MLVLLLVYDASYLFVYYTQFLFVYGASSYLFVYYASSFLLVYDAFSARLTPGKGLFDRKWQQSSLLTIFFTTYAVIS